MRAVFRGHMAFLFESRNMAGNVNGPRARIKLGDPFYSANAVPCSGPKGLTSDAIGTHRADPCDHDASSHFRLWRWSKCTVLVYALSMDAARPDWMTKKTLDILAGIEI